MVSVTTNMEEPTVNDIKTDIKIMKRDMDDFKNEVRELITAIKDNTKEHHQLRLDNKDMSSKIDMDHAAIKRAHERIDEYDSFKNKMIIGVLSAIGMGVLGLIMKVSGH